MNSRRLTVSYRYPDSRCRILLHRPEPMPFLRLQGRWLEQAGFAIGVQVMQGCLVLGVIEPQPQSAVHCEGTCTRVSTAA
jgi:hypothetical protein